MKKQVYDRTVRVIRDYMKSLKMDDVVEWAKKDGLLTQNKKLSKGTEHNLGIELLPANISGTNLCGKEGHCKYSCLVFTGINNLLNQNKMLDNGIITSVLGARAKRTFLYLKNRKMFDKILHISIQKQILDVELSGKTLAIRLNVFSDIDWTESNIITSYPQVMFYDYTKYWERKSTENYNLTYSYSETVSKKLAMEYLSNGSNVAIVFAKLPETWNGYKVVDGDISDSRYKDERGVVIGLKVKNTIGKKKSNKFLTAV